MRSHGVLGSGLGLRSDFQVPLGPTRKIYINHN